MIFRSLEMQDERNKSIAADKDFAQYKGETKSTIEVLNAKLVALEAKLAVANDKAAAAWSAADLANASITKEVSNSANVKESLRVMTSQYEQAKQVRNRRERERERAYNLYFVFLGMRASQGTTRVAPGLHDPIGAGQQRRGLQDPIGHGPDPWTAPIPARLYARCRARQCDHAGEADSPAARAPPGTKAISKIFAVK